MPVQMVTFPRYCNFMKQPQSHEKYVQVETKILILSPFQFISDKGFSFCRPLHGTGKNLNYTIS